MKTSLLIAGSLALVPMTYAQDKPNIIIILADDLGFSDLGCFGGEIHTPVLDKLAKNGVRMTQMYNSARSCPSHSTFCFDLPRSGNAPERVLSINFLTYKNVLSIVAVSAMKSTSMLLFIIAYSAHGCKLLACYPRTKAVKFSAKPVHCRHNPPSGYCPRHNCP